MKKVLFSILAASLLFGGAALADGYRAGTGSAELDVSLGNFNLEAKSDLNGFVKRLSLEYGVEEKRLEVLIAKDGLEPGDVYMAVRLSLLSKRPLEHVVGEFKANRGKGWGAVAKNLGIKPGSDEFHALKNGLSPSSQKGSGHARNKHGKGNKHGKHD